jgi:HNH endonuclease
VDHGDPRGGGMERRSFLEHILITEHGLEWGGAKNRVRNLTYGQYNHQLAHRLAYAMFVGPIPEGDYVIDHEPGCPKTCVTPDHLNLFTRGEHTKIGWARGEIARR